MDFPPVQDEAISIFPGSRLERRLLVRAWPANSSLPEKLRQSEKGGNLSTRRQEGQLCLARFIIYLRNTRIDWTGFLACGNWYISCGKRKGKQDKEAEKQNSPQGREHRKKEAGENTVTFEKTLPWPAVACLALDVGSPSERESNLKPWPPYQVENPKMKKTQGRRLISGSC